MKNLMYAIAIGVAVAIYGTTTGCRAKDTETNSVAADVKPYPLDTCLVCGMKLSMMEKPTIFVYQGQQIKVCDGGEKAEFEKDPAKFLKKLPASGLQK